MRPEYRTRFAPSPTGPLHLGHAYSAMLASDRARAAGGSFLLRIEDTDLARCRPEYEAAIYEVLGWLGLSWPEPVLQQSEHLDRYRTELNQLIDMGLCYPCQCSRADIRNALAAPQEGVSHLGPDGVVYPGTCRGRRMDTIGGGDAVRLDMARAIAAVGDVGRLGFMENGPTAPGLHRLNADRLMHEVGDIVLARRDIGTAAYHLAVVVDDAAQGITEVVRGADLAEATVIHRLLQALLQLPTPSYYHHELIRDGAGKRLAKRDDARALAKFRRDGATAQDIRRLVGLQQNP
jgi:glutamyl-Q tRNA(Asp) synthetase